MVNLVDDRQLLAAWRLGDGAAGGELLRRHFSTLSRFFRYRAGIDPADLIQKTLLGCIESRERVPEGLPFRVYMLGVARRVLLQHFRAHARDVRHSGAAIELVPVDQPSLSALLTLCQQQRLLLRALRMLPLDLQLTLQLHYWEKLKVREIAVVFDVAEGTIKYRLSDGRARLRQYLLKQNPDPRLLVSTLARLDDWASGIRGHAAKKTEGSSGACTT